MYLNFLILFLFFFSYVLEMLSVRFYEKVIYLTLIDVAAEQQSWSKCALIKYFQFFFWKIIIDLMRKNKSRSLMILCIKLRFFFNNVIDYWNYFKFHLFHCVIDCLFLFRRRLLSFFNNLLKDMFWNSFCDEWVFFIAYDWIMFNVL